MGVQFKEADLLKARLSLLGTEELLIRSLLKDKDLPGFVRDQFKKDLARIPYKRALIKMGL